MATTPISTRIKPTQFSSIDKCVIPDPKNLPTTPATTTSSGTGTVATCATGVTCATGGTVATCATGVTCATGGSTTVSNYEDEDILRNQVTVLNDTMFNKQIEIDNKKQDIIDLNFKSDRLHSTTIPEKQTLDTKTQADYNKAVEYYNLLTTQYEKLQKELDDINKQVASSSNILSYNIDSISPILNAVHDTSILAQNAKYANIDVNIDLYNAIQKENIILQQYYKDLTDKMNMYDYNVEKKWENIEFYKTFNKYLFYIYYAVFFYIAAKLVVGYSDFSTLYKTAIIILLFVFPLYITAFEFYIKDQLYYAYCVVMSKPYKKLTITNVPYDYYFY